MVILMRRLKENREETRGLCRTVISFDWVPLTQHVVWESDEKSGNLSKATFSKVSFCLSFRTFLSKYAKIHPSRTDKLLLYGLSDDRDIVMETWSLLRSDYLLLLSFPSYINNRVLWGLLSPWQTMDLNLLYGFHPVFQLHCFPFIHRQR